MAREYSRQIALMIQSFLQADDWHFKFDSDDGVFNFSLNTKTKLRSVNYKIFVYQDAYTVYTYCPLSADEDVRQAVGEYLTRANYGLRRGNFEMDFRDGEIRYKVHVDCEDSDIGTAVVKSSIYIPAVMFERYGNGLVEVLFNLTDPKSAVEQAEAQ